MQSELQNAVPPLHFNVLIFISVLFEFAHSI
jgi:hypothetical protein